MWRMQMNMLKISSILLASPRFIVLCEFYDIFARACAQIQVKVTYGISSSVFSIFFSPFLFLVFLTFAAVVDLQLGLASCSRIPKKASAKCSWGKFSSEFYAQIFVHILGSIEPITLLWELEISFLPQYRTWVLSDAKSQSKLTTPEF